MKIRIYCLLILGIPTLPIMAQNTDVFARVAISPRSGIVQQPFKVTISVYTATWYTKPLQFENLQIENAFIIPFTQTLSSITYIKNKPYATLSFYYLVFPYKDGQVEIPELKITATTPPLNSSTAKPIVIHSKKQIITVKPLPKTEDNLTLMVAKNITLHEKWNKHIDTIKVGDVLKRSITIDAYGSLPSFIPPLPNQEIESVSTYGNEPTLQDKRNENDVNGRRTETMSYLFEKEGLIVIPELKVNWVNSNNQKIYSRKLPPHKIFVKENPDLSMLASIKDSLNLSAPSNIVSSKENHPISRETMLKLILGVVISFFLTFCVYQIIKKYRKQKEAYLLSKEYYHKLLLKTIETGKRRRSIHLLYQWFYITHKSNCPIESLLSNENKIKYYDLINISNENLNNNDITNFKIIINQIISKDSQSIFRHESANINPI